MRSWWLQAWQRFSACFHLAELARAFESAKYCHNCGAVAHSFQNDPEREIIEHYFHFGYKYDVFVSFMRSWHDIYMDKQTLKRRLVRYKLSRNESWRNKKVKNLIKEEMRGSGCLAGYRKRVILTFWMCKLFTVFWKSYFTTVIKCRKVMFLHTCSLENHDKPNPQLGLQSFLLIFLFTIKLTILLLCE